MSYATPMRSVADLGGSRVPPPCLYPWGDDEHEYSEVEGAALHTAATLRVVAAAMRSGVVRFGPAARRALGAAVVELAELVGSAPHEKV